MSIEISPSSFEFSDCTSGCSFNDEEILSCCATLIMRGTEVLDYKTYGFMDLESRRPLMTMQYTMYSNTKFYFGGIDDALGKRRFSACDP